MRKIFLSFIIIVVFLVACVSNSDKDPQVYKINYSTGLYDSVSIDTEQIAFLDVGTEVSPVNENGKISCHTTSDGLEMCHVKVLDIGKTGYILRKRIDY